MVAQPGTESKLQMLCIWYPYILTNTCFIDKKKCHSSLEHKNSSSRCYSYLYQWAKFSSILLEREKSSCSIIYFSLSQWFLPGNLCMLTVNSNIYKLFRVTLSCYTDKIMYTWSLPLRNPEPGIHISMKKYVYRAFSKKNKNIKLSHNKKVRHLFYISNKRKTIVDEKRPKTHN